MSLLTESRLAGALDAALDLSRLVPGAAGDVAIAGRILAATERALPGTSARVVLAEGGRLFGFAPPDGDDDGAPHHLGSTSATPEVLAWMRGTDPLSLDDLPATARKELRFADPGWEGAVLLSSGIPQGFLAIHQPVVDATDRQCLELLATHAGVVVENSRLLRQMEHEAETDGLTGAYNYRYFMRSLEQEMDRVRRHGTELVVVMVDVDNLKEYNDSFGHLGGSAALREMAGILREASRSIDVVTKYGGDEFSLLLPQCGRVGALLYCERVREQIAEHAFENDPARRLTVSMGLAVYPGEGDDPLALLRQADARLYEAKRNGRNRIAG